MALGGGVVVAVGVTVVCSFAVSNAVALTDVAGVSITGSPVVVPSVSATPTAAPSTSPEPSAAPQPSAETVPAPEPRALRAPSAPKANVDEGGKGHHGSAQTAKDRRSAARVIAQFERDGDWNAVTSWVAAQGWDMEMAQRWLRFVHDNCDPRRGHVDQDPRHGDDAERSSWPSQTPVDAGNASGHDPPREWTGSKKGQSQDGPPARRD